MPSIVDRIQEEEALVKELCEKTTRECREALNQANKANAEKEEAALASAKVMVEKTAQEGAREGINRRKAYVRAKQEEDETSRAVAMGRVKTAAEYILKKVAGE